MFFIIEISYKVFKNLPHKKFESHPKSMERTYKTKQAPHAS